MEVTEADDVFIPDIIIPYVHSEANELRFALRSIEMFYPAESRVILVGDLPEWYHGGYIPHTRNDLTKQLNVRNKILAAIPKLSDKVFILWYDDVYQLRYGWPKLTHCGTLADACKKNLGEWFKKNVENTMLIYPDGFYFGNHQPISIISDDFIESMKVDWKKDYLVKSLYGNFHCKKYKKNDELLERITGEKTNEYLPDCKFRQGNIREFIKDKQFFSTDTVSMNTLNLLNELFPTPSKYEKGDSN